MKRQKTSTTTRYNNLGVFKKALWCLIWLGIVLSSFAVQAQTITWTGAASNNWNTPANWDTGVVPGANDQVTIPEVTNSPRLDQDRQVGTLEMTDNSSLDLSNFTLTVNERLNGVRTTISNGKLKVFKYANFLFTTISVDLEVSTKYFQAIRSTFKNALKLTYKDYANGGSDGFYVTESVFEGVTELIQERDNQKLLLRGGTFKEKLIVTNNSSSGAIHLQGKYPPVPLDMQKGVEVNILGDGQVEISDLALGAGQTISHGSKGVSGGKLLLLRVTMQDAFNFIGTGDFELQAVKAEFVGGAHLDVPVYKGSLSTYKAATTLKVSTGSFNDTAEAPIDITVHNNGVWSYYSWLQNYFDLYGTFLSDATFHTIGTATLILKQPVFGGNVYIDNPSGTFRSFVNEGLITFNGNGTQVLDNVNGEIAPVYINKVALQKPTGRLLIQTPLDVQRELKFTQGGVNSVNNALILRPSITFPGADGTQGKHIEGSVLLSGHLGVTHVLPLGKAGSYRPIRLSYQGSSTTTQVEVEYLATPPSVNTAHSCIEVGTCEHWRVKALKSTDYVLVSVPASGGCALSGTPQLVYYNGNDWEIKPSTVSGDWLQANAGVLANFAAGVETYITIGAAKDAGTITTPAGAVACQNTTQTYAVPAVAGATYTWTVPTGWTIAAGQGTHQVTVDISTAAIVGNNEVQVGYTAAGCTVEPSKFYVIVNPIPAAAGAITGANSVCPNTQASSYSIPAIAGADEYVWALPTGASQTTTGATGTVTTTNPYIEVDFASSFATGDITVKAKNNQCGEGIISTLTIHKANAPTISLKVTQQNNCNATNAGTIEVTTNGASYTLYQGSVVYNGLSNQQITNSPFDLTGLTNGDYKLVVKNALGCEVTSEVVTIYNDNATFVWAKRYNKASNPTRLHGKVITQDAQQNIYTFGYFTGTITLGGQTFSTPNPSSYSVKSGVITKHDKDGNLLWAKQIQNDGDITTLGMTYSSQGYIYVTGYQGGNTTFGAGEPNAQTLNGYEGYLAKFNANNGQFVWLRQMTGLAREFLKDVETDSQGNVYVAGSYETDLNLGGITLTTPMFQTSGFVAKYNQDGQVLWAQKAMATNMNTCQIQDIAVDANGQVYLVGKSSDVSVVIGNLALNGSFGFSFVAKLNVNGSIAWANALNTALARDAYKVTIDVNQEVLIAGPTIYNTYVGKFAPDGNQLWLKEVGNGTSSARERFSALATDPSGSFYLLNFSFSASADKIYRVSNQGNILWAKFLVPSGNEVFGQRIFVNGIEDFTIMGNINANQSATFGTIQMPARSTDFGQDMYLARYKSLNSAPSGTLALNGTTQVCKDVSPQADYVATGVTGATAYKWTLPAGATATSGHVLSTNPTVVETTTSGITIDFTNVTLASATLKVEVSSACGAAPPATLAINLGNKSAAAGNVTGTNSTCANQAVTYTTTTITGAYEYVWTFTPDDVNLAATTHTSLQPSYTFTPTTNGTLTVQGRNACGTGTASSPLAIVSNAPPTITAVANSSTNCGNAGGGELKFNLAFSGAATYRVFKDGSAYSGIQNASVGELTLTGLAIGSYTVELTAGQCVVTAAASVNDGSPLITNIKTSYVSCNNAQMGLFSPATLQFDIGTAQLHPEFKEYTYTVVDPQGGVIVPETTIPGVTQANAASVTGTQIAVTNPQRDEAYAIVIKAYKALDPNTGCSNCREVYCQVSQSFTFRGLPVSVSLQGGSPQYVCDAAGTTDVKVIVNANHDNGLSIAPAGGYRVELINESGTVVSTQEVTSLTNNQLTITGVGVGSYEARVTVGKDNYACVGLAKFEVEDLEVQITVSTEAESCTNANNGKAATVVVGAKKKVTYEWQKADGTVLTDSQGGNYNSGRVEQLAPGDYKVIVTVAGICPNEKTFTIDAYAPLLDSLAVEVDTQKCEVIARAELTAAGQTKAPVGPYHVVWYQLKVDDSFSDGDQADKSKYTKVYESFEASAINATEPDLRVVLDEKYLVFKGWYYVEISGPDKCAMESDPAEIERPRKKRIFEISMRWKAPDIKPKEPELPKFDFQVAFDDAKEQLATLTEKCVQDEQAKALASFKKQCKAPEGNLTVTFEQKQHHYTLYYFDRAGRLTQTVPPAGVRLLEGNRLNRNHRPAHTMRTTYNYNSLGQMVNQHTPDGGTTNFIHDKLGRIRFSQNDKQKDENAYAYVKYDALGRTIEAGRATQTGVSFPATAFNIPNIDLNNGIAANNGFPNTGLSEQVLSFYNVSATFANDQHTGKNAFYFDQANTQTYLRNRVSYTLAYNQGSTDPVRTYFSYDPHGNVTWVIQETPGMDNGKTGSEKLNYRMHLAYDYDLISGKVLKVRFNDDASRTDRFLHRYSYDEDNRLTLVETSRDGYIWDKDAKYDYYLHGPLKRTELGEDKIQGLDYAYTIHGWIKGMNSPVLDVNQDLGGDGKAGSAFAPDVWGMSLTFYDGDYVHDPTSSFAATGSYILKPGTHYNLYNGNIATWTSALRGVSHTQQVQRAFQYKYDRLNRIKTAHMYEWNGSNWAVATNNNALHTNYSYDGNGNLLTLQRYDKTGSLLDNLTYSYKTKSINGVAQQINQLDKVTDAVAGNKIEKEVTGTNQYDYDDIGNLIHDHAEDIVIVWNMQGKVSEVRPATASSQKPHIRYWYDASGNRLKKEVSYAPVTSNGNGGFVRSFTAAPEKVKVSYYTRDMDGNTMAIYERQYNATTSTWQTTQKELSLYGSERLGTVETNRLLSSTTSAQTGLARLVGEKRYELKDHLGNVRSVVTDQKRYLENGGLFLEYANVRTFKNYYPFGMEQPGDEVAPMLVPASLPSGWGIYEMTGWMGSIDLETALKVHLDYAPDTAKWVYGKDYASKPLQTYELSFEVALDSLSDNELKVTIKDAATDQVIKEEVYKTAGNFKLRYLATGDTTRILFHLNDPTPNVGSRLEVTGIALNKTDFGDYRYGITGKEKDSNINFGAYDFGGRIYDSRIGKWLSTDPMFHKRLFVSPYNYVQNNPIMRIDPDGALDDYYYNEKGELTHVAKTNRADRFFQVTPNDIGSHERGEFLFSSEMLKQYKYVKSKLASREYNFSQFGVWTPSMQGFKKPLSEVIDPPYNSLRNVKPITGTPFVGPGSLVTATGMLGRFFSSKLGQATVGMFMNGIAQYSSHSIKMKASIKEEWSFSGAMRRIDWADVGFAGIFSVLDPLKTKYLGEVFNPLPMIGMSLFDWSLEKGPQVSFYNKPLGSTLIDLGVNTIGYGLSSFGELGTGFMNFWSGFISPNTKTIGKAGPLNPDNKDNLFDMYKKNNND